MATCDGHCAILAVILALQVASNQALPNERLRMRVDYTQPCARSRHKTSGYLPSEKIILGTGSGLKENPNEKGCYYTQGGVIVTQDVKPGPQMYVEMRLDRNMTKAPERCYGYSEKDYCGGFGTCLYCSYCDELRKTDAKKKAKFTLRAGKEEIKCNRPINKGNHSNINLYFCLPTKRDFTKDLQDRGVTKQTFNDVLEARGAKEHKMSMFITAYIFEQDVRRFAKTQHETYQLLTDDFKETLNTTTFDRLSIAGLVKDYRTWISCQKIVGSVYIKLDDGDWDDEPSESGVTERKQPEPVQSGRGRGAKPTPADRTALLNCKRHVALADRRKTGLLNFVYQYDTRRAETQGQLNRSYRELRELNTQARKCRDMLANVSRT